MKLYNKDNLKNSRIFFDKKPPKFMTILIYFSLLLVIVVFFCSSYINKNYIVKAVGQIADKNIIYVSSNIDATIIEIKKEEGDWVKEGEIIIITSNGQENTQRAEYEKILSENKYRMELLGKYRKSLDTKTNLFIGQGSEQEYYGKVQYYLQSLENENQNSVYAKQDIEKKRAKLDDKISQRNSLQSSLSSLEANKEYYADLIKYYESLNYQILDLEEEISKLNLSQVKNQTLIDDKEKRLKSLKVEYRNSNSIQEKKFKADSEFEVNKSKIEGLNNEIESLKDEVSRIHRQASSKQSDQIYFQFINEIGAELKSIEKSNSEINMNISVLKDRDNNFQIRAPKAGRVHFVNSTKLGTNVQANQTLVELSTLDSNNYYVDAYINVIDISKIKLNQDVEVAISGVNTYKYGTLKGKISAIENSIISLQGKDGKNSFYKALIEIDDKFLVKGDEKIDLFLSMPVEVRIIYDKETYLDYFLEKISFKE